MADLSIGENLIYGSSGVYCVSDISTINLGLGKKKYYRLTPCTGKDDTTVYLPADYDESKIQIKKLLSKQAILDLIDNAPNIEKAKWINDPAERRIYASKIISQGDRTGIISLIKTLYFKELERGKNGKKLYLSDERILECAQNVLYDEFSFVLGIKREDVISFITDRIENKT